MRLLTVLFLVGLFSISSYCENPYPQRWNYITGHYLTEESSAALIDKVQKSIDAGCTHVLWSGSRGPRIDELTEEQKARAVQIQKLAAEHKLQIVPNVISIGYSGRYFHYDSNLAAGIPVKEMPYIVKGNQAVPDPSLALDPAKLKPAGNKLTGTYTVKPFMYYRVFFTIDREPRDRESLLDVRSSKGKRRNSYTNTVWEKQDGKLLCRNVFNTLEGEEITFTINHAPQGISDIRIEPAGMLLILRRPQKPLKVTNEDGSIIYEEGKDFKPVSDPIVTVKPFPGEFTIFHDASPLELTEDSRISDGRKLKISFFHHIRIYFDQDLISMEDEAAWEIFEKEIQLVTELWPTNAYNLNYDEIRIAGWENMPGTPGEMLAAHFKRSCELVKKYAPDAQLYTWSDMFTPYHNARPFSVKGYYYLVKGNWDGAWEGLDPSVTIFNWYSPDNKTISFFADRGHKQILCGYYDRPATKDMKKNITRWMNVSQGIKGIEGFMYTSWKKQYKAMPEYFELVESYDAWGDNSVNVEKPAKDY